MSKGKSNQNINTSSYWEIRFSSNEWEKKGTRSQTRFFARDIVKYSRIQPEVTGTILDFGCGLGDSFEVYKQAFPYANLIGMDFSKNAIEKCREKYGEFATFIHGTHKEIQEVDIIISSNVFEHLSDHIEIASHLLSKCKELHILVPYKEFPLHCEHINQSDYHHSSASLSC